MSVKSNESSGKTQAYLYMKKNALQDACQEHGLAYEDGDKPGKAPTNIQLQARLYLADAGGKPDAAMEADMCVHLKSNVKNDLLEVVKKLDSKTTATKADKNHQLALSIARAVISQHKRTNVEGSEPATNVAIPFISPQAGHLEDVAGPDGETYASVASWLSGGDLAMEDADTPMMALGQADQSSKRDRPSPSVSVKAQMSQVKRSKLDGANLPTTRADGWRAAASTPEAAASSVRARGHTVGDATSQPGPSQPSHKGGFWNIFGSSNRAREEYDSNASYVATGGQDTRREQAALSMGNVVLDFIMTDPNITGLLSQRLATGIQHEVSAKLFSANAELEKERKANSELKDRVAELEEELDEIQKRQEELGEEARAKEDRQRAVLSLVRRELTDWRELQSRVGVQALDLLQNVERVLDAK